MDHIVPGWTNRTSGQIEGIAFVFGDLAALVKDAVNQKGANGQAGVSGGAADVVEHSLEGAQGFACPVERYLAEEAVLNRVVLGSTGWVVTDQNRKTELVCKLPLQFKFPKPETAVVATARITEDEDLVLSLKAGTHWVGPPLGNGMNGKLRRIMRVAHIDSALVVGDVIDAIGDGPSKGVVWEIMGIDLLRRLAPSTSRVGEVADEFLVLGVDTDDGVACLEKVASDFLNVAKLPLSVRMVWTG